MGNLALTACQHVDDESESDTDSDDEQPQPQPRRRWIVLNVGGGLQTVMVTDDVLAAQPAKIQSPGCS